MEIVMNQAYKSAKMTDKRYRIIFGGAGSGKSHYVAQETILNMLSSSDYSYLAVRKTNRSIRHSVYQLIVNLIGEYDLNKYFAINKSEMSIQCTTGSRLITSGLDDVEKLKSIAGINRIWVEEASEISESDLNQLDLRMRGHSSVGHQMTLTFNPISELHWIKKKYFDVGVKDAFVLKTTYKDNSHLDQAYIDRLERLQDEDYQYYRIYTLGEWGSLGNLIYTNWERADLTEIKAQADNIHNGLDWGFASDPFAFVRCHYDKTRKTIYILDEVYKPGLHNDQAAELIKPIVGRELVTADSAEPKSVSDFQRHGINCKGAKKGPGSVEHGIRWLQGHKIVVDESCTNFIKEISGYKWREDKDGNTIPKPVDYNDHLLDALRYAVEPLTVNKGQWGW